MRKRIRDFLIIIILLTMYTSMISCTMGKSKLMEPFASKDLQEDGALEFEFRMSIKRSQESVFNFFRDIDQHPQDKDSPVLLLEKTTDGPPHVGTQYIEIVKMLPLIKGRFISEITHYEPNNRLEMMWIGGSMKGYLIYRFEPYENNTKLYQRELIKPLGISNLFRSYIKRAFSQNASNRLKQIKAKLELKALENENIGSK